MSSLTVVGSGIQFGRDITRGARECIKSAGKVLYLISDRPTEISVKRLNPTAESLHAFYGVDKPRSRTYRQMVERIMSFLSRGLDVCVVAYGHPGIFASPMHEAVRRARKNHHEAYMLPGISCIDWLYADLDLDPATTGCQIYEATHFLKSRVRHNPDSALILLQVGFINEPNLPLGGNTPGFCDLAKFLSQCYGPEHEIIIYEAAQYVIAEPKIQRLPLNRAASAKLSLGSTLYVPPKNNGRKTLLQRRAGGGTRGRTSLRQTGGSHTRKSLRSLKTE